jgi:opacity protein-like surface antigen
MKRITKLSGFALLLTSISSVAFADNWNVGASASYANIDGTASDTQVTGAGVIVAQTRGSKSGDANFPFGSIFVEYAKTMNKDLDLIIGLDYVPFKAEIDSVSRSDSSLEGNVDGVSVTGIRKATLELENYATLYLQPTFKVGGGTSVYGKVGYIHGDVKISGSNTATSSTINAKDTLNGYTVGLGVQHNIDKNLFVRLEGNYTDHDTVTATDSKQTKFTADSEMYAGKISIGYSF